MRAHAGYTARSATTCGRSQLLSGYYDEQSGELHRLPPNRDSKSAYVAAMGGEAAVLATGGAKAFDAGDYRWVADWSNHVVFSNRPTMRGARCRPTRSNNLG